VLLGACDTGRSTIDLITQEWGMRQWSVQYLRKMWPAVAGLVIGYRWDDGGITEHATVKAFLVMLAGGALQNFVELGRTLEKHEVLLKLRPPNAG
jgi:hypothetical protein